jgi:glutamyl-tRNA synthetase
MGWNDGSTQEVFTKDELVAKFSLDRVQRSGARFDERRLLWANGHFIRQLTVAELSEKAADFWPAEAATYDEKYRQQVLGLVQERLKFFAELPELTWFFFTDHLPVNPDLLETHKQLKKLPQAELKGLLELSRDALQASSFETEDLQTRLNQLLVDTDQKPVVLFSLIRIAITQAPASPGLAETLQVLGKERSLKRIQTAYDTL